MPTTINSLPPELILHILEFVAPDGDQDELDPARRSPKPEPNPLLATALVNRRFGRLSQQLLFRQVHLASRRQARVWQATAAGVHTQKLSLSYGLEPPSRSSPWTINPLPLAELLAPSEAHAATGRELTLKSLHVLTIDPSELQGDLSEVEMLKDLTSLVILLPLSPSCILGPFASLRHLSLNLAGRTGPCTTTPLPSVTHLSLTCIPAVATPSFFDAFPYVETLSVAFFPPPGKADFAPALAGAPASLTHFATERGLPAAVAQALPATVTRLTFQPRRGVDLRVVLDRWFGRARVAEAGCLNKIVLLGLTEDEVVRYYARGAEFMERVAAAGCEVECRKKFRLDWRE